MELISIVIPVYQNTQLFLNYLKLNKPWLKNCEIIVVNDFPEIKIEDEVKNIVPEAIIIHNSKNLGFGPSVNRGVQETKGEYLFFLNSDVILPNDDFLKAVAILKKEERLFAVSLAQVTKDGTVTGSNSGKWVNGWLKHNFYLRQKNEHNFWAEGGSMVCKKTIFKKLGGFEELFSPFYWEDIDLSYRAWKSGYQIMFTPEIIVKHQHETTIGKYFSPSQIKQIAWRNELFFHWLNLTEAKYCRQNFFAVLKRLMFMFLKADFLFFKAFCQALVKISQILKKREERQKFFILTDQAVFNIFQNE